MKTKSVKNAASVREIPLHPDLLVLGLRQFVDGRGKRFPGERVFREFRLGARGKLSDGLTRFFGPFLVENGLWKEGRATHVYRHTFVDRMRAAGVADEDIAALVGHTGSTQTSHYGGAQPLARKAANLQRLDLGFDLVAAVGGPYDPRRHRA